MIQKSMFEVQEIKEKKIWETFITTNYSGSYPFFQSWNWGEVLDSLQVPIIRLGFFTNGTLVGILLVVEIKAKRGHYLYLRHGPIFLDFHSFFPACLEYVKTIAKEKKTSFIRISRLLKTEEVSLDYFKKQGFMTSLLQIIDGQECWVLDITKPDEELLKEMRKSHRYLIRKAQTMPIEIIKSNSSDDLSLFLPIYKDLSKRKKFVPHKELEKEFKIFSRDNEALLFLAKYEGRIIAGAFIAFTGNQAIYRHGASSAEFKQVPASYLLQWEAIKEAKKRNKKTYNFWGIAPEASKNHPWSGHTLFKTGFGGTREYYLPTIDLPLNMKYWKNYLIDWGSKIKKGY